jgi:hypothetical protein
VCKMVLDVHERSFSVKQCASISFHKASFYSLKLAVCYYLDKIMSGAIPPYNYATEPSAAKSGCI